MSDTTITELELTNYTTADDFMVLRLMGLLTLLFLPEILGSNPFA